MAYVHQLVVTQRSTAVIEMNKLKVKINYLLNILNHSFIVLFQYKLLHKIYIFQFIFGILNWCTFTVLTVELMEGWP